MEYLHYPGVFKHREDGLYLLQLQYVYYPVFVLGGYLYYRYECAEVMQVILAFSVYTEHFFAFPFTPLAERRLGPRAGSCRSGPRSRSRRRPEPRGRSTRPWPSGSPGRRARRRSPARPDRSRSLLLASNFWGWRARVHFAWNSKSANACLCWTLHGRVGVQVSVLTVDTLARRCYLALMRGSTKPVVALCK